MRTVVIPSNKYYDIRNVLSYDRLFTFSVGGRGIGKTYSTKMYCCDQFEQKGDQFIFVRRYKDELRLASKDYFNSFLKTPGHEHYAKQWSVAKDGTFLFDGRVGGYYCTLDQLGRKGLEYPNVGTIFFDEFIAGEGYNRYYPNEFDCFLNAVISVSRFTRTVRCILCANAVSNYNPYFVELGYYYNGTEIWAPKGPSATDLQKESLVQWCKESDVTKELANTRLGKAIRGTRVGQHALYNESLRDNEDFLKTKGRYSDLLTIVLINGREYGIWYDRYTEDVYVSNSLGNGNCDRYAVTEMDKRTGYYSFRALRSSGIWVLLVRSYDFGNLYFEDVMCKGAAMEMFKRGYR